MEGSSTSIGSGGGPELVEVPEELVVPLVEGPELVVLLLDEELEELLDEELGVPHTVLPFTSI